MAKTDKKDTKSVEKYECEFKKDYESDWAIHRDYIQTFDAYEAMLIGQVYDSVSNSVDGSKITDSYATTLAKERADRVMAKLPEGETQSVGKADVGKAAFMDILRQKWIYPNANAQHQFFEKLNMWQLYSSVYGYMPMFYDWNVSASGYVGPDCWLWNPRNLVPQQGRASIADMDYVTALTWVGKKHLKDILDDNTPAGAKEDSAEGEKENEAELGGWDLDALKLLIETADSNQESDYEKDTLVDRERVTQSKKKGICLATRYEAGEDGEWVTFAPDHSCIEVRRLKNPHKNGRIPFVIKYSQPLFDSFYGLGDFQRAKPLQFARDGLTNFYFKGIKMNLIPPIIANANGVMKHTIDYREGAVMMETIPNSIRRLETSTAGLATYQAAQSNLTGSLLSLYGTGNASIPGSDSLNPSQGKTPAAVNMYSDKEATRDGAERRHLETAIEELTDGFFSLVVNIGTEDIPVDLFSEDIKEINEAGLSDVMGLFTTNPFTGEQEVGSAQFTPDQTLTAGELKINPEALKGVEYRFNIEPNSTAKVSKEKQLQELGLLMDNIGKFQNIFKDDPRVEVNWGAMMEAFSNLSDVSNADEFITVKEGPSPQEIQAQQEQAKMEQEMQMKQMDMQAQQEQAAQQAAQPPEPTITQSGMYADPHIGQVAQQLEKL